MHASSNFVVLLDGKKEDRKIACEYLQQYADDELEDDVKIVFEETYEIVWLDDVIDAFAAIAKKAPKLNFVVSGYVDCSENSGEFMDFGIIRDRDVFETYNSDWLGYDGEDDDDSRECRLFALQDMDIVDIKEAFKEVCEGIRGREWDN